MKQLFLFFISLSLQTFAQESLEAVLIKSSPLQVDQLISLDGFGSIYYIKNNAFHKKTDTQELSYSNIQLGSISSINTFNPLKLVVFYDQFNTVIILDNRLSEIFKIDFNELQPYKNVSLITTGYDNVLWLFNSNLNQLELFDYKTRKSKLYTLPVASKALGLASNYNFCWLLTEKFLFKYNYLGSLIQKLPNEGFTELREFNGSLILKKENNLFLLKENDTQIIPVKIPNLLIKQFFVTNETLYLYDSQKVHEYKLTIN